MLVATLLVLTILVTLFIWRWQRRIELAAQETPPVLVFSWQDKVESVASERLTEWLAMRQLMSEEWPPMKDLLTARKMIGQPTTEEELRREVWNQLEWVRRALKRGREALE